MRVKGRGDRNWTDEELRLAIEMRNNGFSSTQIGGALNRTRNSIIGKLDRDNGIAERNVYHPLRDNPRLLNLVSR